MNQQSVKNKQKLKLSIPMHNGGNYSNNDFNFVSKSIKEPISTKNNPLSRSGHQKSSLPEMPSIYKQNQSKNLQGRPLSLSKSGYSPLNIDSQILNSNINGIAIKQKIKESLYNPSRTYHLNSGNSSNIYKEVISSHKKSANKFSETTKINNEMSELKLKGSVQLANSSNLKKDINENNDKQLVNSSESKDSHKTSSTNQLKCFDNNLIFNSKSNKSKLNPLSTTSSNLAGKYNKDNLFNSSNYKFKNTGNGFNEHNNKTNTPSTTKNQPISIMSLFASNLALDIRHLSHQYPYYDLSKYSAKSLGVVKSYSANTHQGTVRDYNEDRVSIILNIIKPSSYTGSFWPKCSFFGIYDGHGGSGCAEFLRDNLHHFVVRDENFPVNPKESLIQGFKAAENEFVKKHAIGNNHYEIKDKSGSCALVVLVVDDFVYVANVGDSRAVLSKNRGSEIVTLSKDHKPDDPDEAKRIINAGGKIYQ